MNSSSDNKDNDIVIGGIYCMNTNNKLGSGSFGEIYQGQNLKTKEEVAVKFESHSTNTPLLSYESKILKLLQGGVGIPNMYLCTNWGGNTVMIMEQLGRNLEDLMLKGMNTQTGEETKSHTHFSLKTVLMIADQLLDRIEYVHSKGIIHRDIKPENFLIGLKKKCTTIHLIDYGLAKKYIDSRTGQHIPFLDGKALTGTARFASIYTHMGIEQSRRDDLESLGYVFIYLAKGILPWHGIKGKTKKEKYKKIMEIKAASINEGIAMDLPEEFELYFKYTKTLQFDEKPNYYYLKELFRKAMSKNQIINDHEFDWCVSKKLSSGNLNSSLIGGSINGISSLFSNLTLLKKEEDANQNEIRIKFDKIQDHCK